ncbi:DUF3035 domain-containing protein [Frigidibacter sp. MR17.24]
MLRGRTVLAVATMLGLAACGSGDRDGDGVPNLMNLRSDGADEFSILPTKPLEQPADYAALPEPTPGGTNITDPTPEADAIAALGGNVNALRGTARDQGLLSATGRFGSQEAIRPTLAAEDLAWRRENQGRFLERVFSLNRYYKAYDGQSLDQEGELQRWRARGVRTVGAPPPPTADE